MDNYILVVCNDRIAVYDTDNTNKKGNWTKSITQVIFGNSICMHTVEQMNMVRYKEVLA